MKKAKERMTQVIVRIPQQYADMAKEIGKNELRSYSSVLRRAIIEWLEIKGWQDASAQLKQRNRDWLVQIDSFLEKPDLKKTDPKLAVLLKKFRIMVVNNEKSRTRLTEMKLRGDFK